MTQAVDPLVSGREAAARHAWHEAYAIFREADARAALVADDLELFAESAYWSGRLDEALETRERAYRAHTADGSTRRAAGLALKLGIEYLAKGSAPISNGWFAKGERLLEHEPESPEHGLLELAQGMLTLFGGELDASLRHHERAYEIGLRFGDRDLQALAIVGQGRVLLLRGELDKGLKLLDEASAAAVGGELNPFSSCMVYCMTITSCHGVGDYHRARQWTDIANKWCEGKSLTGFPGACRVHRSEILRLSGDWEEAEHEAVNACEELSGYDIWTVAAGYYQVGEIRRRRGDFAAAEEAYGKAHELGREPQPGLALLRLAQGKVAEAEAALRHSLEDDGRDPLGRARRLPAQVEVALAAGDLATAENAVAELDRVTDGFRINGVRTPLLEGTLQLARGQIELAAERWPEAEACLRRALTIWAGIGAPYEAAKARMLLGTAYERQGDEAGARAEFELAKGAFQRLGAVLDAQIAMELLGEAETRRTFLFTDIVDSTKLLDALGDEKWSKLLDRHDALLRQAIEEQGGEVIKHTGDGFFAAFDTPPLALDAAARIQRVLQDEFVSVRIGLHSGAALDRGNDYAGRGVNVAARVGALATGGEILVSRETLDGLAVPYRVSSVREAELKGFDAPVEVVAVDWR
ncbi:MAG: adenylate/guanylate cyclase domain-containing protein [Pseudomonadota bacterium]